MDHSPDLESTLLVLLVADDRGSPCAEQALVEFAKSHPAACASLGAAEYALGLRYLNGEGIDVDLALARHHFESAAVFGHPFPDALRWVDC
ncbi:hypothetical protein B7R22_04750 [Subtercola boreus]|uniref:Sel1 repeat family protein n=1 Tax=Subtercola boreus TaxID=120213 RepID=A0A3E0W2Q3_9MICO|nr:SEL1-like repeat protein [Subtercola boreus]RFA16049.1 hypothetical protein B7R22_04750 [Subtercola boreus]